MTLFRRFLFFRIKSHIHPTKVFFASFYWHFMLIFSDLDVMMSMYMTGGMPAVSLDIQ